MKKKLLVTFLIIFTSLFARGQITITTTSNYEFWSPEIVENSGGTLTWSAANNTANGGTFMGQTIIANDPTFNFITNNGTPIEITVSNTGNDFSGWTELGLNGAIESGDVTDIDIGDATALATLNLDYNEINSLDLSQNTELVNLTIRGGNQLYYQTLNTDVNTKLEFIRIDGSAINNVDFSNNLYLIDVIISDSRLTSPVLDKVLNDLDNHGLNGGNLEIDDNLGILSYNSFSAYNSLKNGKSWTIDVPAPPSSSDIKTMVLTTTANSSAWQLERVRNNGLVFNWSARNTVTGFVYPSYDENSPQFDFSNNSNEDPIEITITSNDGFIGFLEISLYDRGTDASDGDNDGDIESKITDFDISNAVYIERFYPNHSSLNSLDISQNIKLQDLYVHGTVTQLGAQPNQTYDISNNPDLKRIRLENTGIISLDVSSNDKKLYWLDLANSEFTSNALDQILIDLDQYGMSNPPAPNSWSENIRFSGNPSSLTSASYTAYNNLISKGWTIDVAAPPAAPGPDIDVTGLGISIPGNGTNIPDTTDDTDFGQIESGNSISKTFTIENLGDQVLDLIGSPDLVSISGANVSEFVISAVPTTPIAVNGNTTFEVAFNANSLGTQTAILTIASNDPDEASYSFNIKAEATAVSGTEINVSGSGISIPNGNTSIIADGTDFGQVAVGSPITHAFTIENLGDSDLTVYSGTTNGTAGFSQTPSFINPVINSGDSFTFDVTFTAPATSGVQTGQIIISSNDSDENPYFVNLIAEGVAGNSGIIDVQGNGITIANGDLSPDVVDDTDFEQVAINTSKTNTYTIYNTDLVDDLVLTDVSFIVGNDAEFILDNLPAFPANIAPGGDISFNVIFSPTSIVNYEAIVNIDNSDDSPYQFAIEGEGADVVVSGDIMITQYYSGFNSTDKWIEIRNMSGADIAAGTYFLALYDDSIIPTISSSPPTASEPIPFMATDEVLLFSHVSAVVPSSGNIGNATQIPTTVCDFDGDDVILISTTDNNTCYGKREDIIGDVPVVPSNPWGLNASFIKGGCASEEPHSDFDINDWIRIPLGDVEGADPLTNIALGTQYVGPSIFDGTGFLNGLSDRSRTVVVTNSFASANLSITACNLIVNAGTVAEFNSNGNSNNSIILYGDLITDGSLIIGDTESLVTLGDNPNLGSITKIEKSTTLYNLYDTTYWSSPVLGSQKSTIFTGVDATRIWEYNAGNPNPNNTSGSDYEFWWNLPTGSMLIGYGYAAQGPVAPVDANWDYITPFEHELTFVGEPFTGTKTLDLYYKGEPDVGLENKNFNLIGNPYPTAIDIDKFFDDNDQVREIALWTHATPINGGEFNNADYVTYNRDGSTEPIGSVITKNIGSGQGFMARTTSFTDIRFTDGIKMIDANNQFFKSASSKNNSDTNEFEGDKLWLEMVDNKGNRSNIMVGFSHKATDGLDSDYDSYGYVSERDIKLYSTIDQEVSKFVIQNLSSFNEDKKVSLGIDNKNIGEYKISIVGIKGVLKDAEIYLVDNQFGNRHNLKYSGYEFEQTSFGEFPDRFKLQFVNKNLDIEDIVDLDKFSVFNQFDILSVESGKSVDEIKVYDLLGRMIIQKLPKQKSFQLNTSSVKIGTLMLIEARMNDGSLIKTKSIKY